MISSKQFERLAMRNRSPLYFVILSPAEDKRLQEIQSQGMNELIGKYKNVFERPSSLPPRDRNQN